MSIVVDNLTISYHRHPAVHHLGCRFDEGSMWAICGPNGAGKSTLLKAIMGLLKSDTGSVSWPQLSRPDIAYLPQQADIDRSQPMSVYELAALGLWYEIGFFGGLNRHQHQRVKQQIDNTLVIAARCVPKQIEGRAKKECPRQIMQRYVSRMPLQRKMIMIFL